MAETVTSVIGGHISGCPVFLGHCIHRGMALDDKRAATGAGRSRSPDPDLAGESLLRGELSTVVLREEPVALQQLGERSRLGNGAVAQHDDAVAAPYRRQA